ncbi:MAG TPA: hypothetical protein VG603_06905, partial [Chitinophagales bacterium]|nr:hypothetical protein [Chitinophagales bacterium]
MCRFAGMETTMDNKVNLSDFVISSGNIEMAKVLISLAEGCKIISHLVNNAGVSDIIGGHDTINIH